MKRVSMVAAAALAAAGCAGSESFIRADSSRFPISLSDGVRDEAGRIVPPERIRHVGQLSDEWTSWSMLWTLIPLSNRTRDISEAVNAGVERVTGNAVLNLSVQAMLCVSNVLTIVGLLPGCTDVKLSGDIVQVLPAASAHGADPGQGGSLPAVSRLRP